MVGRTNVSIGGGGGSAFLAYLQVATDPNTVITAVNLAGNTFSGTADGEGALVLNISDPGTYTVTGTNGGEETIAIADNGAVYQVTVIGFDGIMIASSATVVQFESVAYSYGGKTGRAPTIGSAYSSVSILQNANYSGLYKTVLHYNINSFTQLEVRGNGSAGTTNLLYFVLLDDNDNLTLIAKNTNGTLPDGTVTYNLPSFDSSKRYSIGFLEYGTANIEMYCKGFKLI